VSTVITTLPARTWRLRTTGSRPLTVNRVADMHRQAWATHTRGVRAVWAGLALQAKIPRLDCVRITVTPLHRDHRSPQDVAACSPEAKAAIDGLVDARVIPDDDPTHLLLVSFTPADICGVNGMALLVEEVP